MIGMSQNDPMLESYIFEETQLTDQLENLILQNENSNNYSSEVINEIFRIMHTIKGSSAMMLFNNISTLAHSVEDLFYFIREQKPKDVDFSSLSDLILESVDFIKVELQKIKNGDNADGICDEIIEENKNFLLKLKGENAYKAVIFFEDDCEMENLRAYSVVKNFDELANEIYYIPEDIIEDDDTGKIIKEHGFQLFVKINKSYEEIEEILNQTILLKEFTLIHLDSYDEFEQAKKQNKSTLTENPIEKFQIEKKENVRIENIPTAQNIISVNVHKLDQLMDLVGEMVIAEAMVLQNPDLNGLKLDNFENSASQLHKVTSELQDLVMSIRMVPISNTFQKMHRIVRDMSKQLNKEVQLKLIGEDTEVDKNVIEHISDPLMHLVRNSIDHGIELPAERENNGKNKIGVVTIEAKNSGNDVTVSVEDDGQGLNKEKILKKAKKNGILKKSPEEMTDKEIYNLVFMPGFSTNENVTEFSGRGVGMDVVVKNIEAIGGSVSISSVEGKGSTTTIKIPLTLAIIDGMNIKVGDTYFTIPLTVIRESFRLIEMDSIININGNEMVMVRGECYPIIRIHEFYGLDTKITDFKDGIFIMIEKDEKYICIFVDELLGQQEVVVKSIPNYIKNIGTIRAITGCTLLGDGNISLILDSGWLISTVNISN
jgi:two-component system chemotaxis sensor kinase CheA